MGRCGRAWAFVRGGRTVAETRIAHADGIGNRSGNGLRPSAVCFPQQRAPRSAISFFGNFGTQNLSNEYTLRAMLASARKYLPDTEINIICPEPEETSARQRVPAVPMSYRYGAAFQRKAKQASNHWAAKLLRRLLIRVPLELRECVRAWRALQHTRMLVMTGTGMLCDFGIRPFDLHYEILKWSILAKARGAKLLFVSVGAGPIARPLSRFMVKRAVALADYRSYRDRFSKE